MTPDIGNAHVIDWYLWEELHSEPIIPEETTELGDRHDPEDWTRYDGELL